MPPLRGKWENAFNRKQMDNVLKETYVVSLMNLHPETNTKRGKGQSSSPAPDTKAKTDGQKPSKDQAAEDRALEMQGQIPLPKQKL